MIGLAFWIAVWLIVIVVVGFVILCVLDHWAANSGGRQTVAPLEPFDYARPRREAEMREQAYQAKAKKVREQMRKWEHRS
jgi:hypothetical protein